MTPFLYTSACGSVYTRGIPSVYAVVWILEAVYTLTAAARYSFPIRSSHRSISQGIRFRFVSSSYSNRQGKMFRLRKKPADPDEQLQLLISHAQEMIDITDHIPEELGQIDDTYWWEKIAIPMVGWIAKSEMMGWSLDAMATVVATGSGTDKDWAEKLMAEVRGSSPLPPTIKRKGVTTVCTPTSAEKPYCMNWTTSQMESMAGLPRTEK